MRASRWSAMLFFCALAGPLYGVTFNFTYDAANSTPPTSINDPNGTVLLNMMEEAGDIWADIIQDNWEINVMVRWQVPVDGNGMPAPNFSGQMQQFQNHPDNTNNDPAEQNNRAVWTLIRMNPQRTWWVDPTPTDHSEFDITQTLYRDLSAAQQTGWYAGNVPNLLEVGYRGFANSSAPAVMQMAATRDLLTVAVHEVGHTVGIDGTTAAINETSDGDYDIDSQFVGGANFDALSENSTGNAHINPSSTGGSPVLMCRCSLAAQRRLPSAIDVIAGATTANWTDIKLPRIDFFTGSDWDTAGNWEGNRTPSTAVDTYVRHGGTVTLSAFGAAGNLMVEEGSLVSTQDHTLFVQLATSVTGTPGDEAQITINTNGQLDSDRLDINEFGHVVLVSDSSLLEAERINIAPDGVLRGRGTVDINDNLLGLFTSEGTIRATGGGELVIQSQTALALDLAGGEIEAIEGNLRFETGMLNSMGARLTVGTGRQVAFNNGGSIGAGGVLQLEGTANGAAISTGSTLFVGLNGGINADGLGVVENALVLLPSSFVSTEFGDPNSEIRLNGSTFFQGGRLQGHGLARQNGDAFIDADTLIDIDTYDMDGQAASTTFAIGEGHTLTIDSPNIDTSAGDGFDGTIHNNGGTLDMTPDWRLDGTLNLSETNGSVPVVTGPGTLTIHTTGGLNVSGAAEIESEVIINGSVFVGSEATFNGPVTINSSATIETDSPGDVVDFNGTTTLSGGSYVGNGLIQFDGQVHIVSNTSVGMAETDLDGDLGGSEINILPDVTFSVASINLEIGANDGFDGVMNNEGTFSSIVEFRLDGTLNMTESVGAALPTLAGLGAFTIHTTGQMNTLGDTLVNRNTTVRGGMDIGAGTTQINGSASFESTADVAIADGGQLVLGGTTNFAGGSYTGQGIIVLNGDTFVDAATTIDTRRINLDGELESTSITLNNAPLTLNVERIDVDSNFFTGEVNINGNEARLDVNLTTPVGAWRVGSTGAIHIAADDLPPPTVLDGSDVLIDGTMSVDGRVRLGANVHLRGTLSTADSSTDVHFGSGGINIIGAGASANGPGQLTNLDQTTLNLEGGANVGMSVENAGRLEIDFLASEVSIDFDDPGAATIRGEFSNTTTGVFAVELAGQMQGSEYDLLEVIGTARLGGTIEVELINDFVPDVGNQFEVLTATTVIGTFDDELLLDDADMWGFDVTVLYPADNVVVQIDDVFLLGDYNRNGVVDAADYAVWQDALGSMADLLADGNQNGVVDEGDYDVWFDHFGNVAPGVGAGLEAVPEPSTAALLVLAVVGACWRRPTRRAIAQMA